MIQPLLFTPREKPHSTKPPSFKRSSGQPTSAELSLLFQLPSAAGLLERPTSAGRRRRLSGGTGGGGGFVAPARRVVVVAAGVRREDAPGVGGRPLDLLAHVAVVRRALVVAPACVRAGHSAPSQSSYNGWRVHQKMIRVQVIQVQKLPRPRVALDHLLAVLAPPVAVVEEIHLARGLDDDLGLLHHPLPGLAAGAPDDQKTIGSLSHLNDLTTLCNRQRPVGPCEE
jgi:hypothetical protein